MIPADRIPTAYREGYEEARLVDEAAVDNYIAHTLIGDPLMDELLGELASLTPEETHHFIRAGMRENEAVLKEGPQALRDFFIAAPQREPAWLEPSAFRPGMVAFQRNASNILAAFVAGTLLVGFSTLISKSFTQTGRIFDNGVWRLRQNNRHMLEIFYPGGLERHGDGWKLSVRIRFIHGQIRRLLAESEEWESEAWGVPVSAAHMGFAVANFAARTLEFSRRLGAHYSQEEEAGFYAVWRYSGHLMGIPESILYTDGEGAREMSRIGLLCEPPPTDESILMSNALINSAPLVAGIEDTAARRKLVSKVIYPVSRAMIGNELADQLRFPPNNLPAPLLWYRLNQRIKALVSLIRKNEEPSFAALLMVSAYDDEGLSYRLPDHVQAERSGKW